MFLFATWILEEFSTKSHVTVKEKLQKNDLMRRKANVSFLVLHVQKYKFVDFLYTDMQTSNEYPHYHSVLWRRLDVFIRQPFSKQLYTLIYMYKGLEMVAWNLGSRKLLICPQNLGILYDESQSLISVWIFLSCSWLLARWESRHPQYMPTFSMEILFCYCSHIAL